MIKGLFSALIALAFVGGLALPSFAETTTTAPAIPGTEAQRAAAPVEGTTTQDWTQSNINATMPSTGAATPEVAPGQAVNGDTPQAAPNLNTPKADKADKTHAKTDDAAKKDDAQTP